MILMKEQCSIDIAFANRSWATRKRQFLKCNWNCPIELPVRVQFRRSVIPYSRVSMHVQLITLAPPNLRKVSSRNSSSALSNSIFTLLDYSVDWAVSEPCNNFSDTLIDLPAENWQEWGFIDGKVNDVTNLASTGGGGDRGVYNYHSFRQPSRREHLQPGLW